ncbi:reverse transcriptase, partial [Hamiltosporidium tvaerminnensis]
MSYTHRQIPYLPPPIQNNTSTTMPKMQNGGLYTLPSPNGLLLSSVKSLQSNRLMALRTIFESVTTDSKEWPQIVFFCSADKQVISEVDNWRRIIATILTDLCTLTDTTEYINLRDKFLSKIKEISEKEIGKLPSELVADDFWSLLIVLSPMTINAVARIIQAARVGYDEATHKEKPRSAWKENIESKISKLVLSKDLLEKARKQEKLSTSEMKSLKKIMREFNLNLSSVTNLSEALKKITMDESRKQFRRENPVFELFRSRFYRELSERVESEHLVSRDEIVNNHPTTFPSLDEFVNIINWLPNWKAAGIDGIPQRGSDYRPITCMFNLYKLTTKCRKEGLLSENQLGMRALLYIALNKEYGNNLKATWIDILQGHSLSPLLFVLSMNPLSRKLNEKVTKVTVQTDAESYSTNHLLFIDDLKHLAKDSSTLSAMTGEAKEFLEVIGLEINKEKSATNDTCCEDTATLLEGVSVYKYLGIIEDSRGIPTRSSFEEVQSKLISRVERLCHTRLNAKNLFSAINQHAISLINYHIGVLRLEPVDFSKLDDAVRAVLVKNKIHLRPGCKER